MGPDADGLILCSYPDLHGFEFHDRVGIFCFIQRKRDGTGDFSGHGDEGSGWDGRRVEKFPLERDEASLRLVQFHRRSEGRGEGKLQDLDAGSLLQPSGAQHFSTPGDGLSFIGIGRRFDLHKRDLRRLFAVAVFLVRGAGGGTDQQGTEEDNVKFKHGFSITEGRVGRYPL